MTKLRTLFLSSNPNSANQFAIDKEIREVSQKVRLSDGRDILEIISAWAVRPDDLLQYLNQYKPHIVHFSGHGTPIGEIILEDNNGDLKPVSSKALIALFKTLKENIRIVFLNACFSRIQAEAINEVIDFVIGMNAEIGDDAAIVFAASFYRALGFNATVQEAFDQAKTALLLEAIPEENTPELLVRAGINVHNKFIDSILALESASCANGPLRLVDISIEEPESGFPILDIKLRNVGKEVIFLKRAEFKIIRIGKLRNPMIARYKLVRVSWNYNVKFDTTKEGLTINYGISQYIKSNDIDRFTFTIAQDDGDPVLPTLYYFTLTLIFNEDDSKLVSQPIILPIPSSIRCAGMCSTGMDKNIVNKNMAILKEFAKFEGLASKDFKQLVEINLSPDPQVAPGNKKQNPLSLEGGG